METDVAYGAVATDDPDFGRLADFLLGHERIIEVRECEVAGFARDVFGAIEERIDEALGDNGAAGAIDDCGLGDDHEIVAFGRANPAKGGDADSRALWSRRWFYSRC